MAYATGTRLLAVACIILGGATIILIPIFWPLAYHFKRIAEQKEQEREQELAALAND